MRAGPMLSYVIGIALFCAMDAVMKHLVAGNPAVIATWWRYVAGTLFTGLIWVAAGRPRITREMLPVHLLRGAVIALSATCFFWALGRMALVEAVTIAFVAPLMVPPIAALLLGERIQRGSMAAGGVGFLGVVIAVGFAPGDLSGDALLGAGAVLVSALTYAVSIVLMRMRAARDGAAVLGLLGTLFPALVLTPFLLLGASIGDVLPGRPDWGWVLLAGLFGALALQFLAEAFSHAEAQVLAPLEYSALGWASLYGWLFFSEPVSLRVWAGALLIAGACLWQTRRHVRNGANQQT